MEKALQATSLDCPVADIAPLVADLGGYEEALLVFEAFESSAVTTLEALAHAINERDLDEVIRMSHGLKGGARNFGACIFEHAARDLECAARKEDEAERLLELHLVLKLALDDLVEYMNALRTQR